jgi:hypothetical protein
MASDREPPPPYAPTNEIGVKVYPFRIEHSDKVLAFKCGELLPGVTLGRVPDGDLGEHQFMWDKWVGISGLGLAERWVRPNVVVVVDGERYVPGVLDRTREWWPKKDIDQRLKKNPLFAENSSIVWHYAVHGHVIPCLLLLKACRSSFLTDGFVWNKDAGGKWRNGQFGALLPVTNFSGEMVAALHRDNEGAVGVPELADLMRRTEIYYAPVLWAYDRIATALGAFWNFLTAPVRESALLSLVTVIEALVGSTERTELTHQVCARVARVEGTNLAARRDVYHRQKKIYDHRSTLAHGKVRHRRGSLGAGHPVLTAKGSAVNVLVFRDLVATASRVLLKLILDEQYVRTIQQGNDEEFEQYFLDLILS